VELVLPLDKFRKSGELEKSKGNPICFITVLIILTVQINGMVKSYINLFLSAAILVVFVSLTDTATAQISNGNYVIVRFVIEGLQDNYHASELDEQLRAHPDIFMSRSDYISSNYLGFFHPDTQLDSDEMKTMLAVLGLDLQCYVVTPNDGSPINKLDPNGCDVALPDPDEAE